MAGVIVMKRLLLTGGRGFLGRHCLEAAVKAGYEVWATASPRHAGQVELGVPGVTWCSVDLLQSGAVEQLIQQVRPTHMLHTAWETSHGSYWTSPANLDWLAVGAKLFKAFSECAGQRLVVAGTCAEYDWNLGYLVDDGSCDGPATFYGRVKLAHHHAMMAAAAQLGFSAATGRIFFVYGDYENPARIVPYACRQLAAGLSAGFSSGTQRRDFMHVCDVAAGFIALLDSEISGACNVSSGTAVSLGELVGMIGALAGRPDLIHLGAHPERPNEPPLLVGDNAKLTATGWRPMISLSDGLTRTYSKYTSVK